MERSASERVPFDGQAAVPLAAYLLCVTALSGFLLAASGTGLGSLVGVAWGIFLVALAAGALRVEGVDVRAVLPSLQSLGAVAVVLAGFWTVTNLVVSVAATGGLGGVVLGDLPFVAEPVASVAVFASSALFTALPEELFFRGYLQQKFVALAGGRGRRAVAAGVALTAVLFALFHLPRWFIQSGHGVGPALASELAWLLAFGVAMGLVYEATGNLWVLVLVHTRVNHPQLFVIGQRPAELHTLLLFVEIAALVGAVVLVARIVGGAGSLVRRPLGTRSTEGDGAATAD